MMGPKSYPASTACHVWHSADWGEAARALAGAIHQGGLRGRRCDRLCEQPSPCLVLERSRRQLSPGAGIRPDHRAHQITLRRRRALGCPAS